MCNGLKMHVTTFSTNLPGDARFVGNASILQQTILRPGVPAFIHSISGAGNG
jgi:hypothetical protein